MRPLARKAHRRRLNPDRTADVPSRRNPRSLRNTQRRKGKCCSVNSSRCHSFLRRFFRQLRRLFDPRRDEVGIAHGDQSNLYRVALDGPEHLSVLAIERPLARAARFGLIERECSHRDFFRRMADFDHARIFFAPYLRRPIHAAKPAGSNTPGRPASSSSSA